jgi:hypothetical protein
MATQSGKRSFKGDFRQWEHFLRDGLKPALSVAEASKKQYLLFFTTQQET